MDEKRVAHTVRDGGAASLHVVGAESQDGVAVSEQSFVTRDVGVAVVRAAVVWAVDLDGDALGGPAEVDLEAEVDHVHERLGEVERLAGCQAARGP